MNRIIYITNGLVSPISNVLSYIKRIIYLSNPIIVLIFLFSGCRVFKNGDNVPFLISDASYYSWFAGKDEHGTNIMLKLKNVKPDVEFDSITFRNIRVPVSVSEEDDEMLLRGVIYGGPSRLKTEMQRVEESNRLIYTYHGDRHIYILKNIRRDEIKYY